jgi:transposase
MTGSDSDLPRPNRVEVITSVQRRRRWSTEEKVRIVEETHLPATRSRSSRADTAS